jgi:lipopolysaccharide export system protein LptC
MKIYMVRSVLTVIIAVMAVFIAHGVGTFMQAKSQATATVSLQEQQGADAWIQGFSYRQTRSGSTKWVVTADQAQVFDDEHVAKLQNVKVRLFDQTFKKEQMLITSEEGVMNTTSNDFELISHHKKTVMTFEDGYKVLTDKLTWNEAARQIYADGLVVIEGEGLVITGIGLVGDIEKNEFRLLNNVRAEVSSS